MAIKLDSSWLSMMTLSFLLVESLLTKPSFSSVNVCGGLSLIAFPATWHNYWWHFALLSSPVVHKKISQEEEHLCTHMAFAPEHIEAALSSHTNSHLSAPCPKQPYSIHFLMHHTYPIPIPDNDKISTAAHFPILSHCYRRLCLQDHDALQNSTKQSVSPLTLNLAARSTAVGHCWLPFCSGPWSVWEGHTRQRLDLGIGCQGGAFMRMPCWRDWWDIDQELRWTGTALIVTAASNGIYPVVYRIRQCGGWLSLLIHDLRRNTLFILAVLNAIHSRDYRSTIHICSSPRQPSFVQNPLSRIILLS